MALLLDAGEMLLLDEPRRVVPEYQRLLYALPDAAARLRQRLRGASPSAEAKALPAPVEQESRPASDGAVAADARPQPGFDPDLRSSSVVEYAPHGARIHDPRITTAAGEVVNILVRGDVYTYDYEVEFLQPARRIAFGMMIKTTSGSWSLAAASIPSPATAIWKCRAADASASASTSAANCSPACTS